MIVNTFYKYQTISVAISALILASVLVHPVSHLIDLVLDIDAIEVVEINDMKDSTNEGENSELEENSFEKNTQIKHLLDWAICVERSSNTVKLRYSQLHDSVVADIVLPPPELHV